MKKFLKWAAIAIVVIIIIGIILPDSDKTSNPANTQDNQSTSAAAPKAYVEVFSFNGNGMKKSPTFRLNGGNARLVYDYKADEYGGLFSVYVVDKGVDVMVDGGIPEVMIQKTEQSESYIQKGEGEYYLNVNATGNWSVRVEEER